MIKRPNQCFTVVWLWPNPLSDTNSTKTHIEKATIDMGENLVMKAIIDATRDQITDQFASQPPQPAFRRSLMRELISSL